MFSRTFCLFTFTLKNMARVPQDIETEVSRLFPTFSYKSVIQHNEMHSCVCRGTMDGMDVVIKSGDGEADDARYEAELADFFASNRHENVLGCYVTGEDQFVHTIYQDMGMDLRELAEFSKVSLSSDIIRDIFRDILLGLRHISRLNVVHADIKPDNIFIDKNMNVKIGDFGNSFFADECGFVETENAVATVNYRPPDILLGNRLFTSRLDVWSAGCVLAFLAGGKDLFDSRTEPGMVKQITSALGGFDKYERDNIGMSSLWAFTNRSAKKRLSFDVLGEDGNDLLNKMLRYCDYDRISFEEALNHKYFM
ncbi:putative serine/threonine protein kinase [Brazilian marseillevirus]|uniref:putative serine/threonine protein kinase n=1 Tax=Brazilian marseillevirus TaxID=1813599 RepID=UPI000783FDE5|nr:putative serine/threonine protein kinase [Brazilian marseillevirus]AMQ10767.1 putative serine/threonine protein kinase [Brazilian marseillevirus]